MPFGMTYGPDYPYNHLDYSEPTEFKYRIESDNLPEHDVRFSGNPLFTDTFMDTESEARSTAQMIADELGVSVEIERWTINGNGVPHEIYDTIEVVPHE